MTRHIHHVYDDHITWCIFNFANERILRNGSPRMDDNAWCIALQSLVVHVWCSWDILVLLPDKVSVSTYVISRQNVTT